MKQFLILITFLFLFLTTIAQRTIVSENSYSEFRPNSYPSDSVLIQAFSSYLESDSTSEREGTKIFEGKIIISPDGFFRMLNLYVEGSGGATYNHWAENYLVKDDTIQSVGLDGEVFRIDTLPEHNYTVYTNSISRLNSTFGFYNFRIKGDSLFITLARNYGNFIFDLINFKKQQFTDRPKVYPGMEYDRDATAALNIDTNTIGDHEFYFLSDERFLSSESDTISSLMYFAHFYGDELSKYVRLNIGTSEKDILLALEGGDSNEYHMTSEFVNDSLYRRYFVSKEGTGSDYDELTFQFDSLVTDYWYDKTFELHEIKTDTFSYQKKFHHINNELKTDWQISYSRSFNVNGILCYWRFSQDFSYEDNGEQLEASSFNMDLLRTSDDIVLLKGPDDIINNNRINVASDWEDDFIDLNFDGYKDFRMFNSISSGSAGDFHDGYLYNPNKKSFFHFKELSGYNMQLNAAERTVEFGSHMANLDFNTTVQLDGKGLVDYIETVRQESVQGNSRRIEETYTKTVNGKIVKSRTRELLKGE